MRLDTDGLKAAPADQARRYGRNFMFMKKYYAYILIILAIVVPIFTDIIVAYFYDSPKLLEEMYESSGGVKVVVSDIQARLSILKLKSITLLISVFLQ